jgi:diguanylate cyclase (GGDEF)-like protein
MTKTLRTLIVEDSADDAELLLRELRHGGYEPIHARVETPEAMSAELSARTWDIVFCDYTMPHFNAFDALALLHKTGLDLPFIIVSGTIGDDRAVVAMKAGAHDYILKDNLKRLVPAVERELRDAAVRQKRRQDEETIHRLAYTDLVTELPNRTWFLEYIKEAVSAGRSEHYIVALLLMDIDSFKNVNDTLGHTSGDLLLRQIGVRLRNALSDSELVARLGGDEFGILLPNLASIYDIEQFVKKMQGLFEAPFIIDKIPIAVEVSIGVALFPDHADEDTTLLQQADIAMYQAKQMMSGYFIYAQEYNLYSPEKLGLMAELRDAIDHSQLLLHFQPKMEIATGCIVGTEALVRWQHPRLNLLMPDNFIPACENTGLIYPLTRWVLTDALNFCQETLREGIRLRINVNLSARSLHDKHLPEMVENALNVTGVEPSLLTLEITESAIVLEPKRAEQNLTTLSRMGIYLSIDDFGTGYTSLASLNRLPINEIKIDKSFVSNMLNSKKDEKVVRIINDIAHTFGMRVVAEGVETKEILDALAAIGCDEAQGYYISRPQAFESLKKWLKTSPWKLPTPS